MSQSVSRAMTVAVAAWALVPAALGAQGAMQISATAIASRVNDRAEVSGAVESVAGTWFGGRVELRSNRTAFSAAALRGPLSSPTPGVVRRDGGELELGGTISPHPGIAAEGMYAIRTFSSAAGYQRWSMLSLALALTTSLGDSALQATVRGSYSPLVHVTLPDPARLGLGAEIAVTAALPRSPVVLSAAYRFQRFWFQDASRIEELDWLTIGMTWKLRVHR